jgi:hypothetical protein
MIPPSIETIQYWVEVSAREGMSYPDMAHELRRQLDQTWIDVPVVGSHWSELMIENRRRDIVRLIRQLEREAAPVVVQQQNQYAIAEPMAVAA